MQKLKMKVGMHKNKGLGVAEIRNVQLNAAEHKIVNLLTAGCAHVWWYTPAISALLGPSNTNGSAAKHVS